MFRVFGTSLRVSPMMLAFLQVGFVVPEAQLMSHARAAKELTAVAAGDFEHGQEEGLGDNAVDWRVAFTRSRLIQEDTREKRELTPPLMTSPISFIDPATALSSTVVSRLFCNSP